MTLLLTINIKVLDVLEWGQEFSPEYQEHYENVIDTFKSKLDDYLTYRINGYYKIVAFFDFNPVTLKFKLTKCDSFLKFHIENALNEEFRKYKM